MKYNSYRFKLIKIFILTSLLPLTIFILVSMLNLRTNLINEKSKLISHTIHNETENIDSLIFSKYSILNFISKNYELIGKNDKNELDKQKIDSFLNNQVNSFRDILNIYIITENGLNYNSRFLVDFFDVVDQREIEWYKKAKNYKKAVWTTPYKDLFTNKKIITLSMPIIIDNEFKGVIGVDIDFDLIHKNLENIKKNNINSIYLLDKNGNILDAIGDDLINSFDDKKYKDFINGKEIEGYRIYNEYLLTYSTVDSTNWKVVSITEKDKLILEIINMNKYIYITMFLTILFSIILALKYSNKFSNPLSKIKEATNEIQKGNYNFTVEIDKKDEFYEVATAFNNMSKELKTYYEDLISRTDQLVTMNIELEDSYEQLQRTIEQLNKSESKYRMLVENMSDIVWIVDSNNNISLVNNSVKDILNIDKEELIGKSVYNLVFLWKSNKDFKDLVKIVRKKDVDSHISVLLDKFNNEKIVEIRIKRILENDKLVGYQGIMRDVTKRKLIEKELIRKNEELTAINRISEHLISNFDLNWLLDKVTEDLAELKNISLCTIRLVNDKGNLELMSTKGKLEKYVSKKDIPLSNNELNTLLDFEILNIKEIPSLFNKIYDEKTLNKFKNNFSSIIPIKSNHNFSGLLIASSERKFKESDINILKSVVNQVAMVIDNIKLYDDIKKKYYQIIEALIIALDAKDSYTEGHSFRVSRYSYLIAKKLGLDDEICEDIKISGMLHDIGKIGISDNILSKPGKLTEEEFAIIAKHPIIGNRILEKVGVSERILNGVKYHHKRYDLKGYPKDIELKKLPIEASIIGVADAFDAMTSNRSYRNSLGFDLALEELKKNSGKQFDKEVVNAFLELYEQNEGKIFEIANTKKAT